MAKINSTFNGNYYLAHDVDYQKLDEMEQKASKRARRDGTAVERVLRQTFAIPFNMICTSCSKRIVRGTHGYMNRTKAKEKYLGLAMYNIACKCPYCGSGFVLRTDLETAKMTGGYTCVSGCRRVEGDFFAKNIVLDAEKKEAAASKELEMSKSTNHDDFSAFNAKMEAVRTRNQQIDEFVEAKNHHDDRSTQSLTQSLLDFVRSTPDPASAAAGEHMGNMGEEDEEGDDDDEFDFEILQSRIRAEISTATAASTPSSVANQAVTPTFANHNDDAVPVSLMTDVTKTASAKRSRFDVSPFVEAVPASQELPGPEKFATPVPAAQAASATTNVLPKRKVGALASLASYD